MVTAPPSGTSVTELVTAGRRHVNRGSPAQAAACYRAALDQLADAPADPTNDRLRTRAHLGLALAEIDRSGDASAAMPHLAAAEAVLPADADDLRAALLGQRGILLIRTGRLEDALATFVAAEPVLDRTTPSHRASMVLNRGLLHLELGHGDEARADFERAVVEAAAADQPRTAYKARHNLACVAFLEGDLPRAIDGMASAPRHADGSTEEPDPITLMDRGRVLLEAGLADEADNLLARAQEGFEREQRGRDLGEVALVRADVALVAGDLERAVESARTAVSAFTVGGNARWRRRAELVELAARHRGLVTGELTPADADHSEVRDRLVALGTAATALARAGADDPEVAVAARLLAVEVAVATGDRTGAVAEFARVVLPDPASVRLRLRWHTACVALARGDEVQDAVEEGVAELASAQAQVGSRDLRTAMALHGRVLVERGIAAAMRRDDTDALHRAVDLAHAASARLTPVRTDLDGDERRLLAELRAVDNRLWREPDADPDARAAWVARGADLRERLRRRAWRRRGDDHARPDPVVSAVGHRTALAAAGATGVSYFSAGPELFALRTGPDETEVVGLGPVTVARELVGRIRADLRVLHLPHLAGPMQAVVRSSLAHGLDELDRLVARPLGLDGRDAVVVPHGGLALVPWPLLASRRGAGTAVASSATRWVRARGRARPSTTPVVRAFAGPDLVRAEREAAEVAAAWGTAAEVVGADAAGLRAALAGSDVVHLAAHGMHRPGAPLFSSVRLADGPLFAHELVDALDARLVVLSACDVGEQEMRPGDEPLGFAAALLDLGVDAVVGAVAPIRDDIAGEVGAELHRRLAAGDAPATATAAVVQAAWDDGDVAPLVVLGDGSRPLGGTGRPDAAR